MGDAKSRGSREERAAAALAREDARRDAWADEMVADAAALFESAVRRAKSYLPEDATDAVVVEYATRLASIAAQRAVATDLLDAVAPQDEDDEPLEDEEPVRPPPAVSAKDRFSLVTPPPKPL